MDGFNLQYPIKRISKIYNMHQTVTTINFESIKIGTLKYPLRGVKPKLDKPAARRSKG